MLRAQLVKIRENKSLTDPEVVIASQMLDVVLNEYYKMLKHKVEED